MCFALNSTLPGRRLRLGLILIFWVTCPLHSIATIATSWMAATLPACLFLFLFFIFLCEQGAEGDPESQFSSEVQNPAALYPISPLWLRNYLHSSHLALTSACFPGCLSWLRLLTHCSLSSLSFHSDSFHSWGHGHCLDSRYSLFDKAILSPKRPNQPPEANASRINLRGAGWPGLLHLSQRSWIHRGELPLSP